MTNALLAHKRHNDYKTNEEPSLPLKL